MLVLEYHSEQAPEQDIHEKPTQVLVFTSIKAEELRNYGSVAIPKNYFESQKHSHQMAYSNAEAGPGSPSETGLDISPST